MKADIVTLGASSLDAETGAVKWQACVQIGESTTDVESLGEVDTFGTLGVSSMPYPSDDNGNAEALALRNVGGRSAICVGARDTRSSKVAAGLKPGDTCLHSTGPEQSAQVRCLEEKRQVVCATKDSGGAAIMVVLDGRNNKLQLAARGAVIEIDPTGDIALVNAAGAGILIQGSKVFIRGELSLPGMTPGFSLMQCATDSPGGAGALPMTRVRGVGT